MSYNPRARPPFRIEWGMHPTIHKRLKLTPDEQALNQDVKKSARRLRKKMVSQGYLRCEDVHDLILSGDLRVCSTAWEATYTVVRTRGAKRRKEAIIPKSEPWAPEMMVKAARAARALQMDGMVSSTPSGRFSSGPPVLWPLPLPSMLQAAGWTQGKP